MLQLTKQKTYKLTLSFENVTLVIDPLCETSQTVWTFQTTNSEYKMGDYQGEQATLIFLF